ncbi:MAG: phosphoribosyltransferase [Nitrosopumilus sp.]|uniref:phosphoribosyltransferase n=1 Tax=Nitrosopumilus sp. TaxID=2024843 RepID=UPI00247DA6B3|nr:phosphoribosyltransferase [Nitrosopumilus sp.]MCV0392423.1 phosphoribosyltransferase [Nitrosopumilus sp.]
MPTEQFITWNDIEYLIENLSKKISKLPRSFSSITTVSRGGLVPSRLMADHLGIKKIFVDKKKISASSLFVDDIYDSGDTFKKIISNVDDPSKLVFVTLFARRGKKYPKQLVYAKKTINDDYVVFPWDKLEFQTSKK